MNFRIHPSIGVSRVGNSEEYVIAPETMAGRPMAGDPSLTGGLPIRAGTESDFVRSSDLRDAAGALKRHAARFRIFQYDDLGSPETYPRGDGTEVQIGTSVGGKAVSDIIWTVHVANKKTNTFILAESGPQGIDSYTNQLPEIRNVTAFDPKATQPPDDAKIAVLNQPERLRYLQIDPGPRTISGANTTQVRFDRLTVASYYDTGAGTVTELPNYPKSFPEDWFKDVDTPGGAIDTLGGLLTDSHGRLLVLGGYGRAVGWKVNGQAPVDQDVNNDQWFDDASDGPVSATLQFDDGSTAKVHSACVTTTDPSFAPQILNVVSCWDDIYDSWLEKMQLDPDIFDMNVPDANDQGYRTSYKPAFDDQIAPIFRSASLQRWNTNLSEKGTSAHGLLATISADDDPTSTDLAGVVSVFRDPRDPEQQNDTTLMPLHLGDNVSFLTLRKSQYFFLQQWNKGRDNFHAGPGKPLGLGERLDQATLVNLLGGRFSPGIDLTFIVREPELYVLPWQTSGGGPFRIRPKHLAYAQYESSSHIEPGPLLTCGYVPLHPPNPPDADSPRQELEPGDISKFMALPWHTDYNSCATHPPDPNPPKNRKIFWSWPAQRPVAVYTAADVTVRPDFNTGTPVAWLGDQRWSLRGEGTDSAKPENWGRYQFRRDVLDNWHKVGTIVQAPNVDMPPLAFSSKSGQIDVPVPANWYLETQSQLIDTGETPVVPFPNYATEPDPDTPSELSSRDLFYRLMNIEMFTNVAQRNGSASTSPAGSTTANAYPVEDLEDLLHDARAYVDYWLQQAENISLDPTQPFDQSYFPYTEEAFEARMQLIYQELVDQAALSDPSDDALIRTHDDVVTRIIQLAPFNLTDGGWLRNVGRTGPMDEVRSLLYSVYMDELGDGETSKNHCNIYRDLCHSVGYYPPPIESREFAYDPQFMDSAFDSPAFELAISQFTEDYYPEIIGMTLYLEWEVVELKGTRDLLTYFGFDPHFYVMHIGIDNAVNGHGQRAVDAVKLYLSNQRLAGGDEAVQAAWRRIWNGFVAFGNVGTWGPDFQDRLQNKPSLKDQMIAMIARKAEFGSRNHQRHMVGPSRIDDWFSNPPAFLDALQAHDYITAGDWDNSRMKALMDFEVGPMFRVFTADEIDLWRRYTESLGTSASVPIPAGAAMAFLVAQLRPALQQGVPGGLTMTLKDAAGVDHSLGWWLEQSGTALMQALASSLNGLITPGKPAESRFYTALIGPNGPLETFFSLPANPPNSGIGREVVSYWITEGCPTPLAPGNAMALLIAQLQPVQRGISGHRVNMLADLDGRVRTLDWWFDQPPEAFMRALASPLNDIIRPGKPEESRYFTELIAPTGPMGNVFNLPAIRPNVGACRDVVRYWISEGCPLPVEAQVVTSPFTLFAVRPRTPLRLTTPRAVRERHPAARIHGMGTIH